GQRIVSSWITATSRSIFPPFLHPYGCSPRNDPILESIHFNWTSQTGAKFHFIHTVYFSSLTNFASGHTDCKIMGGVMSCLYFGCLFGATWQVLLCPSY